MVKPWTKMCENKKNVNCVIVTHFSHDSAHLTALSSVDMSLSLNVCSNFDKMNCSTILITNGVRLQTSLRTDARCTDANITCDCKNIQFSIVFRDFVCISPLTSSGMPPSTSISIHNCVSCDTFGICWLWNVLTMSSMVVGKSVIIWTMKALSWNMSTKTIIASNRWQTRLSTSLTAIHRRFKTIFGPFANRIIVWNNFCFNSSRFSLGTSCQCFISFVCNVVAPKNWISDDWKPK